MSGELLFDSGGVGELLQHGRKMDDPALIMGVILVIVLLGVGIDRVLFRTAEVRVRRRWGLVGTAAPIALPFALRAHLR